MTDSQLPLEMRPLDEEKLRDAFELFDADKDGEINADELQKVLPPYFACCYSDFVLDHEPARNISYRGGVERDDTDGWQKQKWNHRLPGVRGDDAGYHQIHAGGGKWHRTGVQNIW